MATEDRALFSCDADKLAHFLRDGSSGMHEPRLVIFESGRITLVDGARVRTRGAELHLVQRRPPKREPQRAPAAAQRRCKCGAALTRGETRCRECARK